MRSTAYLTCGLILLSGCAHSNQQQGSRNKLTMNPIQTAARDRTVMCEKLMDEMAVASSSKTVPATYREPDLSRISGTAADSQSNPPNPANGDSTTLGLSGSRASDTPSLLNDRGPYSSPFD